MKHETRDNVQKVICMYETHAFYCTYIWHSPGTMSRMSWFPLYIDVNSGHSGGGSVVGGPWADVAENAANTKTTKISLSERIKYVVETLATLLLKRNTNQPMSSKLL